MFPMTKRLERSRIRHVSSLMVNAKEILRRLEDGISYSSKALKGMVMEIDQWLHKAILRLAEQEKDTSWDGSHEICCDERFGSRQSRSAPLTGQSWLSCQTSGLEWRLEVGEGGTKSCQVSFEVPCFTVGGEQSAVVSIHHCTAVYHL